MESNHDCDDDYCITMYKEGDDIITFPKAEPNNHPWIEQTGKHKLYFMKM